MADKTDKNDSKEPSKEVVKKDDDFFTMIDIVAKTSPPQAK